MPSNPNNPLTSDLAAIVQRSRNTFASLKGARIFITGGTGFVGKWLLESLLQANSALELDARAVVLTRDPEAFRARFPHLGHDPAVSLASGDIVDFAAPSQPCTHVIHAATESGTNQNDADPLRMVDTVVAGTRRVLECAREWDTQRVLFVSSGAVYGPQPGDVEFLSEEWRGGPDQLAPSSAYAEAKRLGELLCGIYSAKHDVPVSVARCFAFVGPYLPIDAHFAIGNFIRDGLSGGPIRVSGDGTPIRSYLYAADLAEWLWTILLRGEPRRAYNVGSEDARTIAEIAAAVAEQFEPTPEVSIASRPEAGSQASRNRYVPSTNRARAELGLTETVGLDDAIRRTIAWHRAQARRASDSV
jgi:nucleoside-diphosphate-sugar epimerase